MLLNFVPDIGNALAGVLSGTQALLNGAARDPAFRRDLLGDMEDNLHYLRFIYENWVVSGSVLSGNLDLIPREVEPSVWLTSFLAPWPERVQEKRLLWEVRVPPDHPPAWLDQDLVELAMENILSVSIAAAPERTRILVSSGFSLADGTLWFETSDQGPEMSGHALSKAIRRSSPVNPDGPRFDDGRYLGLSVASAVARLHGGGLSVIDRDGYACSLRLTLAGGDQPRRS